jgi:hypothetical protein
MGRKRKKPMDKLSRDSCDALAHGMSYGKWMAIKPPVDIVPIKTKDKVERTCERCGKIFYRNDKVRVKYCSPECKWDAYLERTNEHRQRNREKYLEYQRLYKTGYRKKVQNAVSKV